MEDASSPGAFGLLFPLDTTLSKAANPDAVLPGASWLRDLRKLRRTEHAELGEPSDRI